MAIVSRSTFTAVLFSKQQSQSSFKSKSYLNCLKSSEGSHLIQSKAESFSYATKPCMMGTSSCVASSFSSSLYLNVVLSETLYKTALSSHLPYCIFAVLRITPKASCMLVFYLATGALLPCFILMQNTIMYLVVYFFLDPRV